VVHDNGEDNFYRDPHDITLVFKRPHADFFVESLRDMKAKGEIGKIILYTYSDGDYSFPVAEKYAPGLWDDKFSGKVCTKWGRTKDLRAAGTPIERTILVRVLSKGGILFYKIQ
jgi:hypothetical protein